MNGCLYRLKVGGTLDLVCPVGKQVVIRIGSFGPQCAFILPPQTGRETVSYANNSGDIDIHLTVSGIVGTLTSHFPCVFGPKSFSAGEYEGDLTLEGSSAIDIG
jgi:hypothetical protein